MLNRDFTKSNKDYFFKNRIVIAIVVAFLLIGLIVIGFFGMNGNFEFTGYTEFTVKVGSEYSSYSDYKNEIGKIVNSDKGDFDTISISGEGDDTYIIVRYINELDASAQSQISSAIASKFSLDISDIGEHVKVGASIDTADYLFCAAVVLLITVIAAIFAYFRYNSASAIVTICASLIGLLGFMGLGAILRLSVGASYFGMLVILTCLIIYGCFNIFENIREESWLDNNEYEQAISSAMTKSRFRNCILACAVFLVGVLFIIAAPDALKYMSANIMFLSIAFLATILYVVPFVWNVFITHSKRRPLKKTKSNDIEENISEEKIKEINTGETTTAKIGG